MANQVAGSQTKLAADVTQLKTDVESLNSNSLKAMLVQQTVTIAANARINTTVSYTLPTGSSFKAVLLMSTPNAAWITGSIASYSGSGCGVGLHNNATSEVTGTLSVVVLYI